MPDVHSLFRFFHTLTWCCLGCLSVSTDEASPFVLTLCNVHTQPWPASPDEGHVHTYRPFRRGVHHMWAEVIHQWRRVSLLRNKSYRTSLIKLGWKDNWSSSTATVAYRSSTPGHVQNTILLHFGFAWTYRVVTKCGLHFYRCCCCSHLNLCIHIKPDTVGFNGENDRFPIFPEFWKLKVYQINPTASTTTHQCSLKWTH